MPKAAIKTTERCFGCGASRWKRPRRWAIKGKHRLPVCRACYERWRQNGNFECQKSRWHAEAGKIAGMRRRGKSIAEIVRAFPGLPRRTAYDICRRHGLAGTWGYEIGQGGRRRVG